MSHEPPESESYVEKRKFERAYFSSDDNVTGIVIVPGHNPPLMSGNISNLTIGGENNIIDIDGNISDISLGGIYLVLKKDKGLHLDIGNNLTLKEIQANILYSLELNIEMEIRRIHNYEFVEHIGLGCEFSNINHEAREIVRQLVEWGLNSNGDKRCPIGPSWVVGAIFYDKSA